MNKFFIVENGMISENYILALNIDCALKHTFLKYNKHDKKIDKIKIKRKEDLVDANCLVKNETDLQNSLNHFCTNIHLINDISINGPIYPANTTNLNNVNIVSEPSSSKHTISLLDGSGTIVYINTLSNQFEVIFNNIILNVDRNADNETIFSIGNNNKLTFNNSEINIRNSPNIIRGKSNSVVTIRDSSLNINKKPSSDGIGIQAGTVNLENNHLIEFLNNNSTLFYNVNNFTINNNNQFNYLDNEEGIQATQINITSNKHISIQNNNTAIQGATVNLENNHVVDCSNNKYLFYGINNFTITKSKINITNNSNVIYGINNAIVTIKDSSLNINNTSDGIVIQAGTVNLENNHLIEFLNNNSTLFNDVSNLTIHNNNQFNYLDNSNGIQAKQINIISNKQMSFNGNNSYKPLIIANTIDICNSNLLFYKNSAHLSDGILLMANNDIIFDGGSLVALNNTSYSTLSNYSLIYTDNNIIFKNKPWFDISTNLSSIIKMETKDFSGKALLAYNTNLSPYKGNSLDISMDLSLCSYNSQYCRSGQYNTFCFSSTSEANICIDTDIGNLGQCTPKLANIGCTVANPSTIGCRCHMSPPS